MNELIVREYLGNGIEFKLINGKVYANALSMTDSVKLDNWKRSPNTKRYTEVLENNRSVDSTEWIISKKGGSVEEQGTWIHEKLILSLARYISVEFELWCDEQIEILLKERKQVKSILSKLECVEFNGNIDNIVYSKNEKPITNSRVIAEYTRKEHKNIIRDIREEIDKLNNISSNLSQSKLNLIINDFVKTEYLDSYGRSQIEYELGEMATMQIMLKYSTEHRADFIIMFMKMKETVMNMFKVKLIEEVLPQDNRNRQYVYIIENNDNGAIKIGVGNDPDNRLKQLQTGSVAELSLVYRSIICSNAFEVEKFMHHNFKEKHIRGEWFNIDKTEVINELEKQRYILTSSFIDKLNLTNTIFENDIESLKQEWDSTIKRDDV